MFSIKFYERGCRLGLALLLAWLAVQPARTANAADHAFNVTVTADSTQVMAGATPIGAFPKGTTLTVSQTNADWYLIDVPGTNPPQQGWIRKTDVKRSLSVRAVPNLTAEQQAGSDSASMLRSRVAELCNAGKYAAALPMAEKVVLIQKQALGDRHPDYATSLNDLAFIYMQMGNFAKGEPLCRRALAIRKEVLGEKNKDYANSLDCLGNFYLHQGRYAEAAGVLDQAQAIFKTVLGENNDSYASCLNNLAAAYDNMGDYARAEPLYRKSLAVAKNLLGKEHPGYAAGLSNLAGLYSEMGDYAQAEPLYQLALAICKKGYGEKHPDYASILRNLAGLYSDSGDYAKAEPLYRQALAIYKESLGENHPDYAFTLDYLAKLYLLTGDYVQAESLCRQSLANLKKTIGEKHPSYAASLNNLADLYRQMGDFAQAESLCRQALAIRKETLGEKHPDYATSLGDLATLYAQMGDYAKAEPLYRQALAIERDAFGEKHPHYATELSDLALMYTDMGKFAQAEPLYLQSLAIEKLTLGEKHPHYATSLESLAVINQHMGHYAEAGALYRRALAIKKESLGDKHPSYAACLHNLAELYRETGDYARAEPLYNEALEIQRQVLGDRHPEYAFTLINMALFYDQQADYPKAELMLVRAMAAVHKQFELAANVQSERQQLRMVDRLWFCITDYLSISERAGIPPEQVYSEVLAWKGIVSARQQAMRRMRQAINTQQSADLKPLFDELVSSSQELANQSQVIPKPAAVQSHRRRLAELSDRVERLQQDLAAKSAVFRSQQDQQRRTPSDIRRSLPHDAALVDFLEYTHYAPPDATGRQARYERRLVAFVVRPDEQVARIELGPLSAITDYIDSWRRKLGATSADMAVDPGQELRRLVWDKLEPHLVGIKTVLLSPDGDTARFPWPALPGKQPGTYLIDETAIAIVPIPRLLPELMAAAEPAANETPSLLLVGGVDFGADPGRMVDVALDRGAVRGDQPRQWKPLPGTIAEVAAVKTAFARQYPRLAPLELTGAAATVDSVRGEMSKCRYLHFSTHGFFAPPELKSATNVNASQNLAMIGGLITRQDVSGFHPDLLSGLVLAGANRPAADGQEDGILTALEVSGLDLSHVDLATLSACDTGLGQTAGGEGLLGLQRAFQLAGAKTTVASLWQVPDRATQLLMEHFYENLWNGSRKMSKLEALLDAQRWMLREGARQPGLTRGLAFAPAGTATTEKSGRLPPFYWAAFMLSGDWR